MNVQFESMFNLGAFLSYAIVLTFTPGPNNLLSMINAGKDGYKGTLKFMLGIFSGFFILMMLTSYLNIFLYEFIPAAKSIMRLLGTAFLFYLAWKVSGLHLKKNTKAEEKSLPVNSYFTGLYLQFLNPKVILYGLTIISNFVLPHYHRSIHLLFFSTLLASLSFVSVNLWAIFGSVLNRFIGKYEHPFNLVMSLLLVYCALSVAEIV